MEKTFKVALISDNDVKFRTFKGTFRNLLKLLKIFIDEYNIVVYTGDKFINFKKMGF